MLSGGILEIFRLDNDLAEAPARKGQQCSVTPTLIRHAFGLIGCLCMDIMSVVSLDTPRE